MWPPVDPDSCQSFDDFFVLDNSTWFQQYFLACHFPFLSRLFHRLLSNSPQFACLTHRCSLPPEKPGVAITSERHFFSTFLFCYSAYVCHGGSTGADESNTCFYHIWEGRSGCGCNVVRGSAFWMITATHELSFGSYLRRFASILCLSYFVFFFYYYI